MMNQNSKLDFSGQEFYIGIDVHKKNWTSTIRSNQMELKTFSMNPSPEDLYHYMDRNYPNGRYISAYESGFSGFWIHQKLENNWDLKILSSMQQMSLRLTKKRQPRQIKWIIVK